MLAFARELERRMPDLVTTKWWKEERRGVFVDFNQNARDKTVSSAYGIRPTGFVSAPFRWEELDDVHIEDFPLDRFGDRYRSVRDLTAGIDDAPGRIDLLLEWMARDEERGIGDAPKPPMYPKMPGESLQGATVEAGATEPLRQQGDGDRSGRWMPCPRRGTGSERPESIVTASNDTTSFRSSSTLRPVRSHTAANISTSSHRIVRKKYITSSDVSINALEFLTMIDPRRLQFLVEVAERTIAAAADALAYTPSAVSQQLTALEQETGVELLEQGR